MKATRRNLARARSNASNAARAINRAHVLAYDLDHELELDLTHELTHDLELALDLALGLDRALTHDLELARDRAFDLDLDRALTHDLELARDLTVELDRDRVLDRDRALNRALELDRELRIARARSEQIVAFLADISADVPSGARVREPTSLAQRLLAAASRLLPTADRTRYLEEFRSELSDIARAGGSRRAQVAYAVRQVASALRLRGELRAPRRRGATF